MYVEFFGQSLKQNISKNKQLKFTGQFSSVFKHSCVSGTNLPYPLGHKLS